MKYEDLSTPIYLLHKGVEKLNKYNMEVFELFADEVGLSYCDRNRVIAKCRLVYNRPNLKELACPKDLLSERWNYYTKNMGYSQAKVRVLLNQIDESYKNQFIPPNPESIAKEMF